jgi:TolA-binding protein
MQSFSRRHRSSNPSRVRVLLGAVLLAGTMLAAVPAAAQDDEARLRKLEAEVRALQRKVFPNGAGFQPEITPPPSAPAAPVGPTTTPMTDLLARMDSVEAQVARVTAQSEQNTNRLTQIEAKLAAMAPPPPVEVAPHVDAPPPPAEHGSAPQGAHKPATHGSAAAPAGAKPSASRMQAVSAIEKPQSDDPGDDEYSYGYRLWEAKFYPEAEQQLKLYLQKYPKHQRVSFARNLLGRAYYDDGDAREAAKWFLQNYQADKKGARAPDSLLYLAKSMKQLGDTKRACIAAGEFANSYSAEAAGRLKADYDDTRKGLDCSG